MTSQVDWRNTRILDTPASPRGRAHVALDAAMARADMVQGPETERLHVFLDQALNARGPESESESESATESEEPEEPSESMDADPERKQRLHALLDRLIDRREARLKKQASDRKRSAKDSRPSIAMDAASVLSRYVKTSDRIEYAAWNLECNLLNQQKDNSTANERRSLVSYLAQMPRGSIVGDCDPKILYPLIAALERNSNLVPS
jgi:hypothetical protein